MSGKIKTGATTWSSASDIYVKTSASTWNLARTAYVKTDATTWSLWFRSAIRDSFARTTSGSLGNADTGQTWSATSGVWYANGSQAQSDTAATSYPIASINYGVADVSVTASVSPGTGPAVWVNSSGNWYAAIAYQTQVNGTYACNCSCNGHYVGYTIYCSSATCPPCSTSSSTTTSNTTYAATATQTQTGWSYQGAAARQPACSDADVANPSNPCLSRGACNDAGSAYGSGCPFLCPAGQEVGHPGCCSCYAPIYTTSYSCTAGDSLSGSTCTHTTSTTTTTCNACSDPSFGVCGSGSSFVGGGTYPNCDAYGASCQTCGTLVNAYWIRLLQSVGGTVTTIGSDISLSSAAAAIKISTVGNTITYQAYSDTALTTTLGTQGSYTPTSPTTATSHGIIKAPSSYAQGSTIDDLKISG